jgi:hypothetical protein
LPTAQHQQLKLHWREDAWKHPWRKQLELADWQLS